MSDPETPAVQREAEKTADTTIIEWRDFKLTIPASLDDMDTDTLEAFENGKSIAVMRGLLGDQFPKLLSDFKRVHGRKILGREWREIAEIVAPIYGFETQGE